MEIIAEGRENQPVQEPDNIAHPVRGFLGRHSPLAVINAVFKLLLCGIIVVIIPIFLIVSVTLPFTSTERGLSGGRPLLRSGVKRVVTHGPDCLKALFYLLSKGILPYIYKRKKGLFGSLVCKNILILLRPASGML